MVQLEENRIIISIQTPNPEEFLSGLRAGIIDLMQNVLTTGPEGKPLEIERDTAHAGYLILQVLRETITQP